jgi:hypothetical protein
MPSISLRLCQFGDVLIEGQYLIFAEVPIRLVVLLFDNPSVLIRSLEFHQLHLCRIDLSAEQGDVVDIALVDLVGAALNLQLSGFAPFCGVFPRAFAGCRNFSRSARPVGFRGG